MARLSKLLLQVWANNVNEAPNVFIGNVGHILTSAADVINAFSVPDFAVYNFRIDANNNVSFFVGRNFRWDRGADNSGWLYQNPDISYFHDIKGNLGTMEIRTLGTNVSGKQLKSFISVSPSINFTGISTYMFSFNTLLKDFYVPYANRLTARDFISCPVPLLYLPNVTELSQSFYNVAVKCRIYIGNYQGGGMTNTNMFINIISGSTIYFHPIHLTSGAGGTLAESLLYAQSQGAVLRPVHNKDLPNKITDLSISNTMSNSVQVNFTTPAPSTNPIDFYEVWIESLDDLDIVRQHLPITQEITASGQTITGLLPNTTYKLRLCTVDTMYNGTGQDIDVSRRAFSNEIIFKTL